jgi:hypothetical protein
VHCITDEGTSVFKLIQALHVFGIEPHTNRDFATSFVFGGSPLREGRLSRLNCVSSDGIDKQCGEPGARRRVLPCAVSSLAVVSHQVGPRVHAVTTGCPRKWPRLGFGR